MRTYKLLSVISFAALAACSAEQQPNDDFEGASPVDANLTISGKADGHEIQVIDGQPYDQVRLYGDAAQDLWNVMEDAGGFSSQRSGGLDYLYGYYNVCASNGSAAACVVYSRNASSDNDSYAATVHGPRFNSAASELFGAIARAQSIHPAQVNEVSSEQITCAKTNSAVWCGFSAAADDATLTLSFDNLGDLGTDYVYEGWLITPDGPVTSGRFALTANETLSFPIDASLAAASSMFVLTIEPAVGDDPAPSDTHVVAGAFNNGVATLEAAHPAALGNDFSTAMGGYILETPTTANVSSDYGQGVWFLDPMAGPGASFELPELPAGWVYEGWVVGNNGPVSTGRFTSPMGADDDGAGNAAGPNGAPPFPGQDFIAPAMSVIGSAVVLSVEPHPDNSPDPFFFKPLVNGSTVDVGPGVVQPMQNVAANSLPAGKASL